MGEMIGLLNCGAISGNGSGSLCVIEVSRVDSKISQ
jgi:hypothetical protein